MRARQSLQLKKVFARHQFMMVKYKASEPDQVNLTAQLSSAYVTGTVVSLSFFICKTEIWYPI